MNWSKLCEGKQDRSVTSIEWLKVTARKYTDLDPENLQEAVQLETIFIGKLALDIRSKLQKMEGPEWCDSGKLLDRAWKALYTRDKEKETWQAGKEETREAPWNSRGC